MTVVVAAPEVSTSSGAKMPFRALGEVLARSADWITLDPTEVYTEVTVRLWGKGVVARGNKLGGEIGGARRLRVHPREFILSRIDARNGAFGLVPAELDGAVVSNDFPCFRTDESALLPEYLGWLSWTRWFSEACKLVSEGTTNRVRLNEEKFLAIRIPLPPVDEQRRIVAKIASLAAQVDEAADIRILSERKAHVLIRSRLREIGEDLGQAATLQDVLTGKPRNGWSATCDNGANGVPVLTLSAVTGYSFDPTAIKRTSLATDPSAHYWLNDGDLLITRSNTPTLVGHAAVYSGQPSPCIYPDLMMRVPVDPEKANTRFVWYWLQAPQVRDFIERHAKGTSPTMKKISQGTVMAIPFPKVSLQKQQQIVAELDGLQVKVDHVKGLQKKTAAELDALLPSILDKAFKGEL